LQLSNFTGFGTRGHNNSPANRTSNLGDPSLPFPSAAADVRGGDDGAALGAAAGHAAEAALQVAAEEAARGSDPRGPRPRPIRPSAQPRHAAAQRPRAQRRFHQPQGALAPSLSPRFVAIPAASSLFSFG
jgi:hypothetical protein